MDKSSLAHTKWECKYHIVFAPKYRRKAIYKEIRADIGRILSELCKRKGIEIIAAEACVLYMFWKITAGMTREHCFFTFVVMVIC